MCPSRGIDRTRERTGHLNVLPWNRLRPEIPRCGSRVYHHLIYLCWESRFVLAPGGYWLLSWARHNGPILGYEVGLFVLRPSMGPPFVL